MTNTLQNGALLIAALMMVPLFFVGCATPSHDDVQASATELEPWTPTRKGDHPAELQHTAPANIADIEDRPSWLDSVDSGDRARTTAAGPVQATGYFFWRFYSNTFSRSMGDSCRFAPSCSRFAVEAADTGPIAGVLAFARLQRGHLDDGFYAHTDDHHLVDPPSHYFFWRSERGLDAHLSTMPTDHAWYVFIRATDDLPENFFDE